MCLEDADRAPSTGGPLLMGASSCSEDGFKHFDGLLDSVGVDTLSCPFCVHNMNIGCINAL